MKIRSTTDVVYSILNNIHINSRLTITQIMYKSNLNSKQVQIYVYLLLKQKLISHKLDKPRNIVMYKLTPKGEKVLMQLRQINEILGLKYEADGFKTTGSVIVF